MPVAKKTTPAKKKITKKTTESSIPEILANVKGSDSLLAQYVRVYLANQRQGTKSAKTRAEVIGSTRKIYRQKGTGRARHGSRKAALFVGGGVTHGPRPNDYNLKLTKKQRAKAFLLALAKRYKGGDIVVIEGLSAAKLKTKDVVSMLKQMQYYPAKSLLLVYPQKADDFVKASRNIENLTLKSAGVLNTYDLLTSRKILFDKEAFDLVLKKLTPKNDEN